MQGNLLYAISFLNVVVSIIIAGIIFLYNQRSKLHIWISITVLIVSCWAGILTAASYLNSLQLARYLFSFGVLSGPSITVFLLIFYKREVSNAKIFLIFFVPLTISLLGLIDGMLIKDAVMIQGNPTAVVTGPLMPLFNLSYFTFAVVMFILMYKASKILKGVEKTQLKYLFVGLGSSLVIATITSMVLPIMGNYDYGKYSPLTLILYTLPLIYVATKHHLSDTRVVFSEIWAFALVFAMLVGVILNRDAFNLILFVLSVGLSILLVRAVNSEHEKSEKLEIQNQELLSDKAKLSTLDKMKDEFIQMATHELNTPIAIIEGKLSMIVDEKMGPFNDEQRAELKSISDAARRLAKLLKNLFEIAEIQQKMIWLFRSEADVNQLSSEVVGKWQDKAREKQIFLIHKPGVKIPKISIDKDKISDAISQLIENALKFTNQGQIVVETGLADNNVTISVTDTGMGISQWDLQHVFDKFFQAGRFSPGNPVEQQGSGSSLYIIKSVVELHGGRVQVHSELHKGTKFTLFLPIKVTEGSFQSNSKPLADTAGGAASQSALRRTLRQPPIIENVKE